MPPYIFTSRVSDIREFLKKNKHIIIKPIHSYGGNSIKQIKNKINKNFLIKYLKKHNYIMCQKFLPGIVDGDKRVFIINGKIKGSISRVPKKGSILSNLSKGGTAIVSKLSKKEKIISIKSC